MYDIFNDDETVSIDAENAFNSINRETMLKHIDSLCLNGIENCYCTFTHLFVIGGNLAQRTTQGDKIIVVRKREKC